MITTEHVLIQAQKLAVMAQRTIQLHDDILSLTTEFGSVPIDWATPGANVQVDPVSGNLVGKRFSPADVASAKDVLNAIRVSCETGGTFLPALYKVAE